MPKPSIMNLLIRKLSPNFAPEIIKISILSVIWLIRLFNFFLKEFMLRWTAWLKDWMVIYWPRKLDINIVKARSFSGAKISCMTDHVKPTLWDINPDHIVLHSSTNDLRTENTASQIANATTDLVAALKNDGNSVTVSGIVPKLGNLNNKTNKVNRCLVPMCKERNISFLSHDDGYDPSKYLNESKLELDSNGIKIFAENVSRFLAKLNWRQQWKTRLNTSITT